MKKFLAMFIAILMIASVCSLTGCGDKKEPTSTTPTEAPTEVVSEKDNKQTTYEGLFNDTSKIQLNSKNLVGTLKSQEEKILDVESNSSGDNKMTMYLSENLGYTTYTIGEDAYMEMHIPEYKNSDGKTVKAEDLYYKTKSDGNVQTEMTAENIMSSLQLTKDNIVSVKYVETKDVHGVNCDVVEVVHKMTSTSDTDNETVDGNVEAQKSDVEETTGNTDGTEVDATENVEETVGIIEDIAEENTEAKTEIIEVTSTFYFTSDKNNLFGCDTTQDEMLLECYFPDELKIELPKDVKFVDADDETVSNKMLSLYTVLFTQTSSTNETVADSTEAATEAVAETTKANVEG